MHGCKQFLVFNEAYIECIPLIITLFTHCTCAIVRCSKSDTGMSQLFLMNVQLSVCALIKLIIINVVIVLGLQCHVMVNPIIVFMQGT